MRTTIRMMTNSSTPPPRARVAAPSTITDRVKTYDGFLAIQPCDASHPVPGQTKAARLVEKAVIRAQPEVTRCAVPSRHQQRPVSGRSVSDDVSGRAVRSERADVRGQAVPPGD